VDKQPSPAAPTPDLNGFGPRRRSTLRLVLSVALALAVAFALYVFQPGWFSGTGGTGGTEPRASAVPPLPPPTPTPPPPVPPYPYLAEGHTIDNVRVTPLEVMYTRGSGVNAANAGNTYAIVMLRVENRSSTDYPLIPTVPCQLAPLVPNCFFYVLDGQHEKNPPIPYDPFHTALRQVILQQGGQQAGSYTFEVPTRDIATHTLQLLWYHSPVTDANSVFHWCLERRPRRYERRQGC